MVSMTNTKCIALLDSIVDDVDLNSPPGEILIYETGNSGGDPIPNDVDSSIGTSTLLATITCGNPAFGGATTDGTVGAQVALNATTDETNAAAGTAMYARIVQGGGSALIQMTVGTAATEMILNTTTITVGGDVSITAGTLRLPDGGS